MTEAREGGNLERAGVSLGIALVFFAAFHLACGRLAARALDGEDGVLFELDFWPALLLYGALGVLVLVPFAVFTVGLGVDVVTRSWSRPLAAVAHGVVGLILGLGVAALGVWWGFADWPTAVVALAMPPGLAAFATHLVSPTAMKRRAVARWAWAVATVPIAASLLFVVSVFVFSLR
ncbi:hypothetical protein LGT39_11940 [Demequina sp. TTPB684]|uniref:hypothetical protein n=1 Tax=unclassified Demequina TaxID=2620311 RepID=UPI001CF58267|nr:MULTISPECIES: hypothetical protein [unclassified Demequina]MCB2413553.1 hypothetical protein [Demequina sp. TTPB684]UPU87227.1 hypothetical protein LGT36_008045 [Demequina sp. TMPB413]